MNIDLSGKIALVTGGSGELGRVISSSLAACGADVAIQYHHGRERAQTLRDRLAQMGRRACTVEADITKLDSVQAMKETVERELGAPDIIVNNAVIQFAPWTPVIEQSIEDYESQFRSCVLHNVLMARVFVPAMIGKEYGRVIAISSEIAMQNFPLMSAYAAGKRGMDGVLRVLAREIGPHNITVNQVAPGYMISDKHRTVSKEERKKQVESEEPYVKNVPLRHRGEDQDIANAVVFLASDLAKFITGAYLPVCGGNVMPTI